MRKETTSIPNKHRPSSLAGKGCHVWDLDGNEFIEYGMGSRAVTLGHAFEPVVEAAYKQMQLESTSPGRRRSKWSLPRRCLKLLMGPTW